MKRAGIDVIVSMLQRDEKEELSLSAEATACKTATIMYQSVETPNDLRY